MTSRPKLVPELFVADIARSLAFYVGLLQFRVLFERADERFAFIERDGAELMIGQPVRRDRLWPKAELVPPYGRGVNFEIQVHNLEELHDTVCNAGVVVFLPLEERWYRQDRMEIGVRQFAIQDPDGYLLRLQCEIGKRALKLDEPSPPFPVSRAPQDRARRPRRQST